MVWVTSAGTTSQVLPWVGVVTSVQSISTTLGSVSGKLMSVFAVNSNWLPVISTGWVTPLASLTTRTMLLESVAPCWTQRLSPGGPHWHWDWVCGAGLIGTLVLARAIGGGKDCVW